VSTTAFAYTGKVNADSQSKITAKIATTGGNTEALTAGEVEIYLQIVDLTKLALVQ
jgi:hypothetical protein